MRTERWRCRSAGSADRRRVFFSLVALVAVLWCCYGGVLRAPFFYDDHDFVVNNQAVKLGNPASLWNYTSRKFLTLVTFAVTYLMSGNDPFSYRVVSVFLHGICGLLVYGILFLLTQTPGLRGAVYQKDRFFLAASGMLIFLSHPLQTESVTYIWQRSTVLSGFFYLWAFYWYLSGRLRVKPLSVCGSFVLAGVGFFAKGDTITFPGAVLLSELLFFPDERTARFFSRWRVLLAGLVLTVLAFLFVRSSYPALLRSFLYPPDAPDWWSYALTQPGVVVRYLRLLILPVGQSVDHLVPLCGSLLSRCALVPLTVLLSLIGGAFFFRRRDPLCAYGVLWFFLTLAPSSSFLPLSTVMMEHRLYLPLAGGAMVMAGVLSRYLRPARARAYAAVALIGSLCLLTCARNSLWLSPRSLMEDAVEKAPDNARAHFILGGIYYTEGEDARAARLFEQALRLDPTYPDPYNNLGVLALEHREFSRAKMLFLRARALKRDFADPYVNLSLLAALQGEYRDATRYVRQAIASSRNDKALMALGNIAAVEGDTALARKSFLEALQVNPDNQSAWYNIGNLYARSGDFPQAIGWYREALRKDVSFVDAYNNLGVAYAEIGDYQQAAAVLREGLSRAPLARGLYRNLARVYRFLHDEDRARLCEERYRHLGE